MFLPFWAERQFISILRKMYEEAPHVMEQILKKKDAVLEKQGDVILPQYNKLSLEFEPIGYFKKTIEHIIEVCGADRELIIQLLNLCSEEVEKIRGLEGNASLPHIAALSGDFEAAELLLRYEIDTEKKVIHLGKEYTLLDCAAFGGNIKLMRALFEKGVQCNYSNMLCSATYHGRPEIIQLLLEKQWDKNLNTLGAFIVPGDTLRFYTGLPLSLATQGAFARYREEESVRKAMIDCMVLLLEHGASPNTSDGYLAPLDIIDRSLKVAPNRLDKYDICALDLCIVGGADPNQPNSQGAFLKKIGVLIENSVKYWNKALRNPYFLKDSKDLDGNQIIKVHYGRIAAKSLESQEGLWPWKSVQQKIPIGFLGWGVNTEHQTLPMITIPESSSEEYRSTRPGP